MFIEANSFNQPLNNWNVSSVKDMKYMFSRAIRFNQPLNDWDVSNIKYIWLINFHIIPFLFMGL